MKPMLCNRAGTSGLSSGAFTIIEALVATTIVSAGLISVAAAFSLCHSAAIRSDRLRRAATLAERRMELATAVSSGDAGSGSGSSDGLVWKVAYQTKSKNLMLASVSVEWSDHGQPKTFVLSRVFRPRE